MKLKIELEFGNEAMQTYSQAVAAIRRAIGWRHEVTREEGRLMDLNGNTVGKWSVTK